ncbi:MAG TPA: acetate uptake transporter [Chloroflexota bacterium]|nr:acetate uptake transporter [Chloroflexota bacterium]
MAEMALQDRVAAPAAAESVDGRQDVAGISAINSIADPAPLGLGGFAATTFALSLINAGLVGRGIVPMVLTLALFYGGAVQLLAGLWEFRNNRNTFGAVALSTYGVFWLSTWYLLSTAIGQVPAGSRSVALGIYLLVWTIFTLYMFIASLKLTVVHVVLFLCLLVTFIALTLGAFTGMAALNVIGGGVGVLTAIVAWYAAAALVVNSTFKKTVLPLIPLA